MNRDEQDPFEAELRQVKPAPPPAEFMSRLRRLQPAGTSQRKPVAQSVAGDWWVGLLRWLVPATSLLLATAFVLVSLHSPAPSGHPAQAGSPAKALKADEVQVDRELITTFDAVARLPGGQPIRFRCREWLDQVTVQDTTQGLQIEQRTPRMEIVPVKFETY